jgi:hypothetical protein
VLLAKGYHHDGLANSLLLSQPGSNPFDLIVGTAVGAVRNSRKALAVAGSLLAVAAAPEKVTLALNSGGIGTN